MTWADDVRRANEALDWIEARQGPLKPEGYARIETDVRTVRAMAMAEGQDDERISAIRARLVRWTKVDPSWTFLTEDVPYLLARLGALEAERDEWKAKAEQQAQLKADFRAAYQAAQQAGYDMEALRDRAGAERDAALARMAAAEAAIREALYDYDHGDDLGAIDRLRAALAAQEGRDDLPTE